VLAGANKSVDDTSKKVVGTSGPNNSVIAPRETPLGKKALEKPSAISNQQGKKLAENKIFTPHTTSKKSLEKPLVISKPQEEKLAKNKSSTPPTAGKQALKKPFSAISKQQEKEIAVNQTSKRPTRKRSKRNTKENRWYMTNPKQSESDTEKNPWAMDNPNYKFGKILLNDDDLKRLLLLRESSTHSTCNVVSQMMILKLWPHFCPEPMHGLKEMNRQTNSSSYMCNSVICTISSTWMLWI
jgi:hypothetical protein